MKAISIILLYCLLLFPFVTKGHEVRPAYLEITESADGSLDVLWKQPIRGEVGISLRPVVSGNWLNDSAAVTSYTEAYLLKKWHIRRHPALDGETISILGLEKTITDVLLRINLKSGNTITELIKPSKPFYRINSRRGSGVAVAQYMRLGIEHILLGIDHLLFVLGLVLLVGYRKKLLVTITAFTIAHSITLALATLGLVHVQQAAVEAIIALSIVFVGVELVKHYRVQDGFTYKYPWIVAFVFGLLHGFGFAGALADVGLPEKAIPMALFLFNVGVEIGQLFFVVIVLGITWLLRKSQPINHKKIEWVMPYVIGSLASYWLIERITNIF